MNREIKFRGISETTNKWFYGYGVYNGSQGPMLAIKMDDYVFIKEGSEGQFTGLHDKNGVPIYEGDVVSDERYTNIKDVVRYENGKFMAIDSYSLYEDFEDWNLEVIGNIYENPELLKQKDGN